MGRHIRSTPSTNGAVCQCWKSSLLLATCAFIAAWRGFKCAMYRKMSLIALILNIFLRLTLTPQRSGSKRFDYWLRLVSRHLWEGEKAALHKAEGAVGQRSAIRCAEDKKVLAQQHARDNDAPLRRFGQQPGRCRLRAHADCADRWICLENARVVGRNAAQ